MPNRWRRVLAAAALAGAAVACSRPADTAAPVATPAVTLNKTAPSIGTPVEMTYRFVVAADAPALNADYWVFVHFIDSDGELMWTDDHRPPTPVREWKPGATIEYPRTMFIPKFPYVGPTRVQIGLFEPTTGERLPLSAPTEGQRAYDVASFDMRVESDNYLVVFTDGWHETEVPTGGSGQEWQWSMGRGTFRFRNPKREARLYLHADQPVTAVPPQRVEVRLGETVIDTFTLQPGGSELRRVTLPADRLGEGETVEVTVSVDKTFVPALVPALKSGDPRDLGIRVFRVYVEPS